MTKYIANVGDYVIEGNYDEYADEEGKDLSNVRIMSGAFPIFEEMCTREDLRNTFEDTVRWFGGEQND